MAFFRQIAEGGHYQLRAVLKNIFTNYFDIFLIMENTIHYMGIKEWILICDLSLCIGIYS